MTKRTLSVTVDGETYTRTTNRDYTHAIVTQGTAYGRRISRAEWRSSLHGAEARLNELGKVHAQINARGAGNITAKIVKVAA